MIEYLRSLWTITEKVYGAVDLYQEIEGIYRNISAVYSDIANAHFASACQAVRAIPNSKDPDTEKRCALAHLRDAFNIYNALPSKTRKVTFLIFFEEEEFVIKRENVANLYNVLAHLAALIYMMYAEIGEKENALNWRKVSVESFENAMNTFTIPISELRRINPDYVREYESVEETGYHPDGWQTFKTESHEEVSEAGCSFISSFKPAWRKAFYDGLNHKTINFQIPRQLRQ